MESYMKKILSTLVCAACLASVASADFLRVEAGAGAWMQTPSGGLVASTAGDTGSDISNETEQTEGYVWVMVKHFVPIVPNLRVEYVSLRNEGTATGTFDNFTAQGKSSLDMTQYDIIPYYNLLDNTFWVTVDVGIDLKMVEMDYKADDGTAAGYSDSLSAPIPMLYLRARTELPLTGLGAEADVKYISYSDTTVYDVRIKLDYTLGFIPIIQPALEVGYRMQKFESDDLDEINLNLDYAGVYAGLMLRF
jgi:outer membrane protein